MPLPQRSTLFPYTTLFRSELRIAALQALEKLDPEWVGDFLPKSGIEREEYALAPLDVPVTSKFLQRDRKSTRLNSSHANISYAVFCLKKKNKRDTSDTVNS